MRTQIRNHHQNPCYCEKKRTSLMAVTWLLMGLSLITWGCGDDDGTSTTTTESRNVLIDLTKAKVGEQYIIVPYILGDTNLINGKATENAVSFSFYSEGGTTVSLLKQNHLTHSQPQTDHSLRTLINRFDPGNPGSIKRTQEYLQSKNFLSSPSIWSAGFETWRNNFPQQTLIQNMYLTQTSACPNTFYTVGSESAIDTSALTKREHTDYCLIYLSDTGVSEPDPDTVETSITKAISAYKTIFNSDLSTAVAGYTFKPLIVVLPFNDENYWPSGLSNISGAFSAAMSAKNLLPTIYLASDQKPSGASAENEQDNFHATLAHELFHAVFNYSRSWLKNNGDGPADTVAIDEGLAHLCEDILGYGPLNFPNFAGAFLTKFPSLAVGDQSTAIFDDSQESLEDIQRGAAHTFLYYLVSKKGGITFDNGVVNGGEGLSFLQDFFNSSGGVAGLAEAYGIDWAESFEYYLAALSVNNSDFGTTVHDVQELTDNTDLRGSINKYGMKFTNFEDLPPLAERVGGEPYYETADPQNMTDIPLHYYEVAPYLISITEENSRFSVIFDSYQINAGASLIRVK